MIDAVFDTNTFLQAAANEAGPSGACWAFAEERKIRVFITSAILSEIEDVLTRPKVKKHFPRLTQEYVNNMLHTFRAYCALVEEPELTFQLHRDKDDAKFVQLAITTQSKYIVTRDRDLLDLMADSMFSSSIPELNIITPVAFLDIVRNS